MLGYVIIGGILTVTVVVPAIKVGIQFGLQRLRFKVRGRNGESKVNNCLRKFKGKDFARAKDIMLPFRGKTSQIDNLLISRYGIFVIETKNYTGIIKGRENSPKWLQVFPNSVQNPREFYNPVWQNEGHVKSLQALLTESFPNLRYHNIVVFSNECIPPEIPNVINLKELHSTLKARMTGPPVLSSEDVLAIKKSIDKNNIKDSKKRSEHVVYAKESAEMMREREKSKIMRQRAEANKDMAMNIQELYSQSRLAEQIKSAETTKNQARSDANCKSIDIVH